MAPKAQATYVPCPLVPFRFPLDTPQASYSVQVDDAILPNQSAYASTPQFQQLLFQRALAPTNSSQHFVQITAQFDGASQPWLDVDFVTIGDAGCVLLPPPCHETNLIYLSIARQQTRRPPSRRSPPHLEPGMSLLFARHASSRWHGSIDERLLSM